MRGERVLVGQMSPPAWLLAVMRSSSSWLLTCVDLRPCRRRLFLTAIGLGLGTPGRIAVSVALLAPLGLVLGMPFPLGVKALSKGSTSMVAWAWGINGYTSVLGSVLTVVLSIAVGFNMVVWFGACVYLIAFWAAPKLGVFGEDSEE